jgi:hypothetical protein
MRYRTPRGPVMGTDTGYGYRVVHKIQNTQGALRHMIMDDCGYGYEVVHVQTKNARTLADAQ